MPYLGIFRQEFQKTIVIFEISTLEVVNNESLTYTMNFDIRSAFSKVPESGFLESLGPASLRKVCPCNNRHY